METSAVRGTNIEEAFLQIARDIYAKVTSGELQLVDGWDGVRPGMCFNTVTQSKVLYCRYAPSTKQSQSERTKSIL